VAFLPPDRPFDGVDRFLGAGFPLVVAFFRRMVDFFVVFLALILPDNRLIQEK
jgi:hypothetical protein